MPVCVHVCVRAQDTVPLFSEQGLSLIQLGWLAGWPASLVSRVLHICPSGLAQDSTHQDRPCRCGEAGQKQAGGSALGKVLSPSHLSLFTLQRSRNSPNLLENS